MSNNPIITCSVRDVFSKTKNLTGNDQVLIRNHSAAEATMSAVAQGGAAIDLDMYIIRNGSRTVYGQTGTFTEVSSNVFTFSAADSEGRTSQVVNTVSMIDYVDLTCNSHGERIDASGNVTLTCSGNYFNDTFGAKRNSLTALLNYKEAGGSWSSDVPMSVSISGNTYSATTSLSGLDYKKTYVFKFYVKDLLMATATETGNITGKPIFHWGKGDVVFEAPVTFNEGLKGSVQLEGDLRLKGSGNYGNTLYFGDKSYCYISEPEDGLMYIHADTLDIDVDELQISGKPATFPKTGTWTPGLSISGVDYDCQEGWYTKNGSVVTIGFYLKADCDSGYDDENVNITGLPFDPASEGSGGGICSGACVSVGWTFQCFVAEAGSGGITVRVQECDKTSIGNLKTSASGCWYPKNGGTLTLSGTITYMTLED